MEHEGFVYPRLGCPSARVDDVRVASGRRFLIQRWEVDHPEAPDGIAIIGFDPDKGGLRQHYFDSRGVHASTR